MRSRGTRLILVRHGETDWEQVKNPESQSSGRLLGSTDVGLSTRGELRARAVGTALKRENITRIVASPLKRAITTAQVIASELNLSVTTHEALREIDFGACEGLVFEELATAFPETHREYLAQGSEISFPSGESFSAFRSRVEAGLKSLLAVHDGHTILVVTHGGVIRVALCALFKWSPEMFWNIKVDYGSLTSVGVYGKKVLMERINYTVEV